MFFLAFFFVAAAITAASLASFLRQPHPLYGEPLKTSRIILPISSNNPGQDYLRLIGIGGCQEVGRSCFLLQSPKFNLLLDCGIKLPGNDIPALLEVISPQEIDAIIITHAHADHYGFLPAVVQLGFHGIIFGTEQTKDLMSVNFKDPYTYDLSDGDIAQIFSLWHSISPGTVIEDSYLTLRFLPAGHILGAVMVEIEYGGKRLLYSGDFGNESFTVNPYQIPSGEYDLLVVESTYGSKRRSGISNETEHLVSLINQSLDKEGTVLIPCFAVGRAQEILTILGEAQRNGLINKEVPIYVDGLIKKTNKVYLNWWQGGKNYLKEAGFQEIHGYPDRKKVLSLEREKMSGSREEMFDASLVNGSVAKIIVSTSGMGEGPASFYLEKLGNNSDNLVITVGYQGYGSTGRSLQQGCYTLKDGSFNMQVAKCEFSAHADASDIFDLIKGSEAKEVLLVHGEGGNINSLQSRCNTYGIDSEILNPFGVFTIFGGGPQILNQATRVAEPFGPSSAGRKTSQTINFGPDPLMQTIGHVTEISLLQHDFGHGRQFDKLSYDPSQEHPTGPHTVPHSRLTLWKKGVKEFGLGIQIFGQKESVETVMPDRFTPRKTIEIEPAMPVLPDWFTPRKTMEMEPVKTNLPDWFSGNIVPEATATPFMPEMFAPQPNILEPPWPPISAFEGATTTPTIVDLPF